MATITKIKNKTGIKYKVRVRVKNQPTITKTFKSKASAVEWGNRKEIDIKDNPGSTYALSQKYTLSQIIDKYIKEVLPEKPKVQTEWTYQLEWWKKKIGSYPISSITTPILFETRQILKTEISIKGMIRGNKTINNYTASLSSVFSSAVKEWEVVSINPVMNLKKLPIPAPIIRFLNKQELKALLTECKNSSNPYLYPIVVMLLSTGSRKMEIVGLKWKDIHWDYENGVIHETKNKQKKGLVLIGEIKSLLQGLYKNRKSKIWVFPNKKNTGSFNMEKGFQKAKKKAKVENFRIHDLRHTTASYLAQEGVSLREIADVLGHKTLQQTMKYAHLSTVNTKKNTELMNSKIFLGDKSEK